MAQPGGASDFFNLFLISFLIRGGKRQLQLPFLGIPVFVPLVQRQPLLPGSAAMVLALGLGPGEGQDGGSQYPDGRACVGKMAALSTRMGDPGLASTWASLPALCTQPGHLRSPGGKEGGQAPALPSVHFGTSDTKEATEVEKNGMPRVGSS